MAKVKHVEEDLKEQKPAPVNTKKSRTLTITLQVGNPVISFSGEWTTRDVKNILRATPRAYRIYQINKRKQGEAKFLTEETQHA